MTPSPTQAMPPEEEAQRFPYWRRNYWMMPIAGGVGSMGFGLSWPFLPLMVYALGVRDNLETWVGTMMLVFYVISFACGPIWGGIADHYGRKIMVLRAFVGMGAMMLLIPFAPTALWFALLLMLVGIFNGAHMSSQALIVANTPPARIGAALSLLHAGGLAGQTLGPALGTVLAVVLVKPHGIFWISGTLLLAAGMLVVVWVHEVKPVVTGRWKPRWIGSLRELMAVPRVGALFALNFVFAMLWSGNVPVLSTLVLRMLEAQSEDAGRAAFWAGVVAMGLSFASVIALPIWGKVIDRRGAQPVLTFATIAAALTQLPLLFVQSPQQLVWARVVFGLLSCAMAPAIVHLLRSHAPAGMDGRAIAYSASFHFIAMGTAPFLAGLIAPAWGLRVYFALNIVLTVAAYLLWKRSLRHSGDN